jgi:hypothetical protein
MQSLLNMKSLAIEARRFQMRALDRLEGFARLAMDRS